MRDTRIIMGVPVVVDVVGGAAGDLERVFDHFHAVDERFSTYKEGSEISRINRSEIGPEEWSDDMREVFALCEQAAQDTLGYFSTRTPEGILDPSGVVKGWSIKNAAQLVESMGFEHFWVEAGGDIQTRGLSELGTPWSVGIRNPFGAGIVKVVYPEGRGIATSGNYIRGDHIFDPHTMQPAISDLVSITVLGSDVYEADRFATAVFAMGDRGIVFLEQHPDLEGYAIYRNGQSVMTSGFDALTMPPATTLCAT